MAKKIANTDQIKLIQYKKIEPGFFEVFATTYSDKISFEGDMCGGLLNKIIKEVKKEGGKVKKVKYQLVGVEAKKEIKQLHSELKRTDHAIKKAIKILS